MQHLLLQGVLLTSNGLDIDGIEVEAHILAIAHDPLLEDLKLGPILLLNALRLLEFKYLIDCYP